MRTLGTTTTYDTEHGQLVDDLRDDAIHHRAPATTRAKGAREKGDV